MIPNSENEEKAFCEQVPFILALVLPSHWHEPALSKQPCANDNWRISCCSVPLGMLLVHVLRAGCCYGKLQENLKGSCLTAAKSLCCSGVVTAYLHASFWKQRPFPLSIAVLESCPCNSVTGEAVSTCPTAAWGPATPMGTIAAVLAHITLSNPLLLLDRASVPCTATLQEDGPAKPHHPRPGLPPHQHPCLPWGPDLSQACSMHPCLCSPHSPMERAPGWVCNYTFHTVCAGAVIPSFRSPGNLLW